MGRSSTQRARSCGDAEAVVDDKRALAAAQSFAAKAEVTCRQRDASRSSFLVPGPGAHTRRLLLRRPLRTAALFATRCANCVNGSCVTRS